MREQESRQALFRVQLVNWTIDVKHTYVNSCLSVHQPDRVPLIWIRGLISVCSVYSYCCCVPGRCVPRVPGARIWLQTVEYRVQQQHRRTIVH